MDECAAGYTFLQVSQQDNICRRCRMRKCILNYFKRQIAELEDQVEELERKRR